MAESQWAYCPTQFEDFASPSVYTHGGKGNVLLFMSDQSPSKSNNAIEWVVSNMDLWAVLLPISSSGSLGMHLQLTNGACQYNGMDHSEYAIDPATGGAILRIDADFHFRLLESIKEQLDSSSANNNDSIEFSIQPLPIAIAVYSDQFRHCLPLVVKPLLHLSFQLPRVFPRWGMKGEVETCLHRGTRLLLVRVWVV